jgi:hypothetical protein
VLKEQSGQLIVGIGGKEDPAVQLVSMLRDLLAPEVEADDKRDSAGADDVGQKGAPPRRSSRAISMPRL